MRREEFLQIKLWKSAISHARGKKLPQAAGFGGSQRANFFEDHAPQWILKNRGIEQPANLQARARFDQHRAKEPQGVALELNSAA